jgi:hypothetical protein
MAGRKLRRRWLWGAGALSVIGLSALAYGYQQLVKVPQNLQPVPSMTAPDEYFQQLKNNARNTVLNMGRASRLEDGYVVTSLGEEDLNEYFMFSAVFQNEGELNPAVVQRALIDQRIVKATQVDIDDNSLKTVVLFDLSQVSADSLEGGDRLSLLRRFKKIPGLSDHTIAVTIQGKPQVGDRAITVQNPTVSIGNIALDQASAARWLGFSEGFLEAIIGQEWAGLPIDLAEVNAVGQELQLGGQLTAW